MAGRRCFSSKITESDDFFSLPTDAQALYLHLNMLSDDDGFINNAASAYSRIKNGASAMAKLVEKRFILKFRTVYVIKHWRISNSLKNDRIKPLMYPEIAKKVWIKPNKAYTDHDCPGGITLYEARTGLKPEPEAVPNGFQTDSEWIPNGFPTEEKRTEQKRTEENRTQGAGVAESFEAVWAEYPEDRKGNKDSAYQAYIQAAQNPEAVPVLLESLRLWKSSEQWTKEGGRFIPYLANWLMRGTWNTKPEKLTVPNGASGELGEAELDAIRRVLADDSLCGG